MCSQELSERLGWAERWLSAEFNESTLGLEAQLAEMKFFISLAEPFQGMTIRVVSEDITTHRYERDVIAKAFRNITGINVVHVITNEAAVVEALDTQLASGRNEYDAYVSDSDLIGTHWRSCSTIPISDWILEEGADVTLPSLDIHDFIGLDFVTAPDGKIYQLPDQQFANLYWFRYDLFTDPGLKALFRQKYGYELGVPVNWAAYEDIADFFTNEVGTVNGTRLYGHMDYGHNDASLGWRFHDAWLSMAGAGDKGEPNGLPVDEWGIRVEDCRPVGASVERGGAVNSPASIFAVRKYIEWQQRFAPAGTLYLNFSTAGGWPANGQIAQQIFWYTTFTADMLRSSAVNHPDGTPKWRMAPSPHGPYWESGMKTGYQDVGAWTLLDSTPLDRRKAAWLYAQFTVCKSISLKKTLVGLTPIRESDMRSQAMSDKAPMLGGLVEFYRSPDRVRFSPTGTNVPDYPRLAPLWWKNIGVATTRVAAGADAREEATKALDQLAHDMDAMLHRIGKASSHPCAPVLGERVAQARWLAQPGAPKPELAREAQAARTIDYDQLVARWRDGGSMQSLVSAGNTSCSLQGGLAPQCGPGLYLFEGQCAPACPPLFAADSGTGRCEALPGEFVTYRIVNAVELKVGWGVRELEFYGDPRCNASLPAAATVSSGDLDGLEKELAFDGDVSTAWVSGCSFCQGGEAFLGRLLPRGSEVRCLRLYQGSDLGSVATRFELQRDGARVEVYDAQGGAWERWPKPAAGALWRLANGAVTDRGWQLLRVELLRNANGTGELGKVGVARVTASDTWAGEPYEVLGGTSSGSWTASCTRCSPGSAFLLLELEPPEPPGAIACVRVLQEVGPETLLWQRWDGGAWETQLTLNGIGGGAGSAVQRRPLAADAMWRLRAMDLRGLGKEGWEVFELALFGDGEGSALIEGAQAVASGEANVGTSAPMAVDGDQGTWWAGGAGAQQWLALTFEEPQAVGCFRLWQSADRWASKLALDRWNGSDWAQASVVYEPQHDGYFSSCQREPDSQWWLSNDSPQQGTLDVHELQFFLDEGCTQLASSEFELLYAGRHTGATAGIWGSALDGKVETSTVLSLKLGSGEAGALRIGADFRQPQAVRCVRAWQSGARGNLSLWTEPASPGAPSSGPLLVMETLDQAWLQAPPSPLAEQWSRESCRSSAGRGAAASTEDFCASCGCVTCAAGSAPLVSSSFHMCRTCGKGRYSASGDFSCTDCPLGRFNNETGQAHCWECSPGRHAPVRGATECFLCPAGSFQPGRGQDQCALCEEGMVAGQRGQARCKECPKLRHTRGKGQLECQLDKLYLICCVVIFMCVSVATWLLITASRFQLPIEDVTRTEEGITVVRFACHHWLLHRMRVGPFWRRRLLGALRRSGTGLHPGSWALGKSQSSASLVDLSPMKLEVRLCGTGIPWLEKPPMSLLARALGRRSVELVDMDKQLLSRPIESSIGVMTVGFRQALFRTGFYVPMCAHIAINAGMACLAALVGGLHQHPAVLAPLVGGSALLGAGVHWVRRRLGTVTPHTHRIHEFGRRIKKWNPNPRPCPRGPGRAVTFEQVWRFYEYFHGVIGDRDMYYVSENLLKPLTRPSGLSYAELVGPADLMWYVSHYWGTSFRHFVEAVRRHAGVAHGDGWREACYWICSLGNNQWHVTEELGASYEQSSFFLALRCGGCRATVMVLDEDALPLTRSWCLFEVLQTFLLERDVDNFQGLVLCSASGVLNEGGTSVDVVLAVARRLATMRLEDAKATMASDKQMIDKLVESMDGGFDAMNLFVRQNIEAALLTAKGHFERQFEELVDQLQLDGHADGGFARV